MKTAISLFSGAGGCSLGLKATGIEVRLAADIARDACASYAANIGREGVWQVDLAQATPESLLDRANLRHHEIDLLVGGPPCQGFSSAGSRDWEDPRNTLVRKYVELVTALKPTWFVMENVEGLLTAAQGSFFVEAISRFLEAGYWVRAKKVYMERYGLPQRRKRVIVVGNLEQCPFDFPSHIFEEQPMLPLFEQQRQRTILDAIGDLPSPTDSGNVRYDQPAQNQFQTHLRRNDGRPVTCHQAKRLTKMNQERIRLLTQGATMRDLPEHLQHPSFSRRAFRRVMDGTPTERRGGAPSGLKRLIATNPSLTITTASPSEFIHPVEDRLLTLRECARMQSFPDWFEFRGSWSSIATQIGNAIPPLFMEILAGHMLQLATWRPSFEARGRWLGIDATRSNGMSPALMKMLAELEGRTREFSR